MSAYSIRQSAYLSRHSHLFARIREQRAEGKGVVALRDSATHGAEDLSRRSQVRVRGALRSAISHQLSAKPVLPTAESRAPDHSKCVGQFT
jgi:hypothetical protein